MHSLHRTSSYEQYPGGPLIHIFPNGSSVQVGVTSYGISLGKTSSASKFLLLVAAPRTDFLIFYHSESGMNDGPSVFARISAGLDWITSTVCGEIGEWCASNEDGNNCFDATRDTSYSDNIFSVRINKLLKSNVASLSAADFNTLRQYCLGF
jgi:hypothetical protein